MTVFIPPTHRRLYTYIRQKTSTDSETLIGRHPKPPQYIKARLALRPARAASLRKLYARDMRRAAPIPGPTVPAVDCVIVSATLCRAAQNADKA